MLILGIDPGLATTGWAIIRKNKSSLKVIDYGCFLTAKQLNQAERLLMIYKQLRKIITRYEPKLAAVEQVFFYKNVKTALLVGEARGVTIFTLNQNKIPVIEFTPLQVKVTVTNYGRADKQQIQKMIKRIFKLDTVPRPDDAADALAVAYCAALSTRNCQNIIQNTSNKKSA